jgi:hypothetical protein
MSETGKDRGLIIALDFDGVVVSNRFPEIGCRIGCEKWIPELQLMFNLRIILWTVRSDNRRLGPIGVTLDTDARANLRGDFLMPAIDECRAQNFYLWGINENPDQKLWTTSPKVYADYYIDNRNLGVPLIRLKSEPKPCVNWNALGPKLHRICYQHEYGITPKTDIAPANGA